MCRDNRRCPSSRGRNAGGLRPARDVYTGKVSALVSDPAVVTSIARSSFTNDSLDFIREALPGKPGFVAMAKAREELSSEALRMVARDPLYVAGEEPMVGAAGVYENWRASGHRDAPPYHRLDSSTLRDVTRACEAAVRAAQDVTTDKERDKAVRMLNRDLDAASLNSLTAFRGTVGDNAVLKDAVDEMKFGSGHLPTPLFADAVAASNMSVHGRDVRAAEHWLSQRGIDPSHVEVVMSPLRELKPNTGDPVKNAELAALIAREWDGDGEPNARELSDRLKSISGRNADRGMSVEFSRADRDDPEWADVRDGAVKTALSSALEDEEDMFKRTAFVGGGDKKLARKLLSGDDASVEEFGDELLRMEELPAGLRDSNTERAVEERAVRKLLIDAGVHPKHAQSQWLPPAAAQRVKDVIRTQVIAAGEDMYSDDDYGPGWRTRSLEERADLTVAELFTEEPDYTQNWRTVHSEVGYLLTEALTAAARARRVIDETPKDETAPLF